MLLERPQQPPMPPGLLPDAARLVLPSGIVSTGFPATEATCRQIGILFDGWQADLNRCILGKDAEGSYAADTVALSIPRQVGKTYDIGGLVFADSIINPGTTTVWTAHRFKVARESFNEMRMWARRPQLRPYIDYDEITTAAGNESIPFRNGSRILFAARERGSVRGFTKVRRLVLDEGQILSEMALADLVPTMNQAVNPQVILMGTPPKPTDPSEVWTRLRDEALKGSAEGLLYVELSARSGSDPLDREAWRQANPSYPRRTPAKAILRMYKLLSPGDFQREALGIWDEITESRWRVVTESAWRDRGRAEGRPDEPVCFALAAAWPDAEYGSIGLAGRCAGEVLVQVVDHREGIGWMVARAGELADRHPNCGFVLDEAGPSGQLKASLLAAGFVVQAKDKPLVGRRALIVPTAREVGQAFGQFHTAVTGEAADLRHYDQPELDDALAGAATRPVGDAQTWARKDSAVDISPLEVVTLAAWWQRARPAQQFFGSWR
jgi:hypothetical protein